MDRLLTAAAAALLASSISGGAAAQQIATLATTSIGAVPAMATAVARAVSTHTDVQLRTQAMASETQYAPMVNAGQIEFGISNIFQVHYAIDGVAVFEGRRHPELRLAFTLLPFQNGVITHADSGIANAEQLKGKRWPAGFRTQLNGKWLIDGIQANFGYGMDDVEQVAVAGLPQMWDEFKRRRVDVAFVAIGAATVAEIAAAVGGVTYIAFSDDPARVAAMQKYLPRSFVGPAQPPPAAGQTYQPVPTMLFDFVIWTSTHTPEEVVYKTVKAMHENADELRATGPMWRRYDPAYLAKDQGIALHPGAARFFTEKGLSSR